MKNNSIKLNSSKFCITAFQLKIIALITMIIDHTGTMFHGYNNVDLSWMRVVGRISFPLFAFLISEGCRHTKNIKKYMLRLFTFAIISQLCFSVRIIYLYVFGDDGGLFAGLPNYNIFFTLLLGVLSVYFYKEILNKKKSLYPLEFLPSIIAILIAEYIGTDYGGIGVLMIFTAYLAQTKKTQLLSILASLFLLYYTCLSSENLNMLISGESLTFLLPFSSMISLIFIGLYNGKKGRSWKWFFYISYPGHFAILGLIYIILSNC